MKIKKLITLFFGTMVLFSCSGNSNQERDAVAIKNLAEKHVSSLNATQLLQEYLLSIDNDTLGVCYSLVMPKQSLVRLMNEETYPTPGGLEKMKQSLVKRYVYGQEFVDSCKKDKFEDKDWLINNTVNEPINPIWEQIINEN